MDIDNKTVSRTVKRDKRQNSNHLSGEVKDKTSKKEEKKKERKKEIGICLFFVLMLYIKFPVPGSSGSLVLIQTKGVTDR